MRTLPISLVIIVTLLFMVSYVISMRKAWKKEYANMVGTEEEDDDLDLGEAKGEMEGNVDLAKDLTNAGKDTLKSEKVKKTSDDMKKMTSGKHSKVVTGAAITGQKAISGTFNSAGGNGGSNPLLKMKTTTKQLLTFMQLQCSFMLTFDQIEWPASFKKISLAGAFANVDFIAYLQGIDTPEYCSLTMPFLEQFWWHMMLVPILASALFSIFTLNRILCLIGKNKKKVAGRIANENTFWNLLNMILFLLYPGLAQRIFEVYKCTTVHEVPYVRVGLVKDLTVECHQEVHTLHVMFASLFLVLYVIGIPAFMFYILFSHRKDIQDEDSPQHEALQKRFGSLYEIYEGGHYYWELIETGRKALLTGALVVIAPGTSTQIFVGIFLVIAHMLMTVKASPYKDPTDDLLAFLSTLCLLFTLLMGLYLKVQGDDNTEEGKSISGIMLSVMYFSIMSLGFFGIAMAIPCCRRKCEKNCLKREQHRRQKFESQKLAAEEKEKKKKMNTTKVMPMTSENKNKALKEMKEVRLKHGAGSEEYKTAAKKYQQSGKGKGRAGQKKINSQSKSPSQRRASSTNNGQKRSNSKSKSPQRRASSTRNDGKGRRR